MALPCRLSDLEPDLHGSASDGLISFNCPFPGCDHRVRVSISAEPFHTRPARNGSEMAQRDGNVKVWQASGSFPETLTLAPSIDIIEADENGKKIRTLCWHGWIKDGNVT